MDRAEADRLLVSSRRADWAFPTSYSDRFVVLPDAAWVDELLAERDAFRDAVRWLAGRGDGVGAAELAAYSWRLWPLAGDRAGGRAFLAPVVDDREGAPSPWRARALYGGGLLAIKDEARDESLARNEEALAVADEVGDEEGRVLALLGLSRVAFVDGDYPKVRSLAEASLAAASDLRPVMRQAPLFMVAQGTRLAGDLDGAAALFAQSVALNRSIGDGNMVAAELHNLGHVEARRGDADAARAAFAEAEGMARPGDPYDAAMVGLNRAMVAFFDGDAASAGALLDGARGALEAAGMELATDDALEFDWLREQIERKGS